VRSFPEVVLPRGEARNTAMPPIAMSDRQSTRFVPKQFVHAYSLRKQARSWIGPLVGSPTSTVIGADKGDVPTRPRPRPRAGQLDGIIVSHRFHESGTARREQPSNQRTDGNKGQESLHWGRVYREIVDPVNTPRRVSDTGFDGHAIRRDTRKLRTVFNWAAAIGHRDDSEAGRSR
jgi:hypothetical protein